MLKTVLTLMRGAAAAAEEEVVDRSALLILDQQIREAASATDRAKRALALAIAQDEAEAKRLETIIARIADLETRALAALAGGREDLVAEAAEAIATLEADLDS
ncbi:MAG: PspA/IM30 family protein, partial [Xanthobacteraceae bacterium]